MKRRIYFKTIARAMEKQGGGLSWFYKNYLDDNVLFVKRFFAKNPNDLWEMASREHWFSDVVNVDNDPEPEKLFYGLVEAANLLPPTEIEFLDPVLVDLLIERNEEVGVNVDYYTLSTFLDSVGLFVDEEAGEADFIYYDPKERLFEPPKAQKHRFNGMATVLTRYLNNNEQSKNFFIQMLQKAGVLK